MDAPSQSSRSSSPPRADEEAGTTTKKRSHEEMNSAPHDVRDGSKSVVGDNPLSSQVLPTLTEPAAAENINKTTSVSAMSPPAPRGSNADNALRKAQASGQNTASHIGPLVQEGAPTPAKSTVLPKEEASADDGMNNDDSALQDEDVAESPLSNPQASIQDFDWRDLEGRYHGEIDQSRAKEADILTEFNGLCQYFGIWATSGADKEVDRSYKRLKTQMTLVQHHEEELENKRQHYIQVVDAFKSALELLSR